MISKYLLAVVIAGAMLAASLAQEPAKLPPADAPAQTTKLPPEPDKSLKRKIWEGYYNALLNRNYHLERSVNMNEASAQHATTGRIVTVISVMLPFLIISLQLQRAVQQRKESEKLAASLGWWGRTVAIYMAIGFGLWYGIESSLGGSAEQARAQTHKELYEDWKTLAAQWQDLHALSLKREPNDILRPQYDTLQDLAETIGRRETPDLYDAQLHREVQTKLDAYLIKDAKRA